MHQGTYTEVRRSLFTKQKQEKSKMSSGPLTDSKETALEFLSQFDISFGGICPRQSLNIWHDIKETLPCNCH